MERKNDFDEDEIMVGVSDIYKQYAERSNSEVEQIELAETKEIEELTPAEQVEEKVNNISLDELNEMSDKLNEPLSEEEKNSNKENLVTFKGSERGLEIYFSNDNEASFEDIFKELNDRIENIKYVYKDLRMGIVLRGRKFTEEEEKRIVVTLRKNMYMSIDYINSEDFYSDDVIKCDETKKKDYAHTMYYHGTLRSGQSLSSDMSIVIFGDVNPGSEVVAGGNLIVMGSLRGIVQAGQKSNDAYIVAFDMNPKQLRIGDHIARAADDEDDERIKKPHMAYIENDQICIEAIDGTFNLIEKEC